MTYKTILVHCDEGKAASARMELAATLAERHQAHLVGVHVRRPFEPPMYDSSSYAMELLFKDHEEAVKQNEAASSQAFASIARAKTVTSEWRAQDGYADQVLALNARYADLTVIGQNDPGARRLSPPSDLPESVALATGRGILVVPFIGAASRTFGTNAMLCWNASREAARAATEALPLLQAASAVTVMIVEPKASFSGHGAEPGADVATWLSRHGVKVTVQRDVAPEADVGSIILSRAMDRGCDLIVMGIYGHSRLREFVLGGASRTLLASMTVPVLMAH